MKFCREHTYLDSINGKLNDAIADLSKPYDDLVQLASDVLKIIIKSARYIITEIGTDMTVFKYAKNLCS